jgi:hypothetical protein
MATDMNMEYERNIQSKINKLEIRVAISNSTDTNSKPSETRQILISIHFNLDSHKLESFPN